MKSRSYVVGLPVVVTVWEDGTVDYEIDKSEVTSAMWENDGFTEPTYTDEQVRADIAAVDKSLGF